MQVEPVQRTAGADREQVLAGEESGGRVGLGEQFGRHRFSLFDAMDIEANQSRIQRDLPRPELRFIASIPLRGGGDRHQIAQVSDAPVPVLDQVHEAQAHARLIIGEHAVRIEKGGRPVDEDHGRPGAALAQEVAVIVTGRDDDQPVDPSRGKRRDQLLLACLILVGAAGEHQDAPFEGDVFDFAMQRRGKRVGHVLEQDADG